MMLININKIFKDAIYDENADTLEKILASSDCRTDLVEEFAKKEDINLIKKIIPMFKSKGLISNIEEYCNLIDSRKTSVRIQLNRLEVEN